MGKKGKDKKKGKGAEKTAAKTEKKISNKQKKELAAIGEDDIDKIVEEIEREELKRLRIVESTVEPPSRRGNFAFIPHPEKEELILFGGEFYNGKQTFVYNDLYFYNIPHNQWSVVKSPGAPPPRCGHQMVATSIDKGQLWLFGGEFVSPSQSQFYHYHDFWVYHLATKKWDKIQAIGAPSKRSGHRMVYSKKQLFIFGGYYDNSRDYKYFNDLHVFNLETYTWTTLKPSGTAPAPRSGCNMVALNDGRIVIYGGYSKEKTKKDVDKGRVFSDMFVLTPEKGDTTGTKYKWSPVKQTGVQFAPRCSMPMTAAPNNNAYCFGGVYDTEESEEELSGSFYNDLHSLDLEKLTWRSVNVGIKEKKKKDNNSPDEDVDVNVDKVELDVKPTVVSDDGVFTVIVGPSTSVANQQNVHSGDGEVSVFQPSTRMNCGLAVKYGVLYLYGGLFEEGSKQITYSDFYSLDLRKLDQWKTINSDDLSNQEWLGSDSESENESGSDEESEVDSESSVNSNEEN